MRELGFVLFAGCVVAACAWVPQLGTFSHPKLIDFSHKAAKGDVFTFGDKYYRALTQIDFQDTPEALEDLPADRNDFWRHVKLGSFALPKTFGVDPPCVDGDIFHEPLDDVYFRAHMSWDFSECLWEPVDTHENWMGLLRSEIGDTRLGDLLLPSTHDSATSGIDENGILVDRNFLFQVGERVDPDFIANWSLTHDDKIGPQLMAGFRNLDLRIADTEDYDGLFRWYHGMSGDEISEGLDQVGQFARDHPEEVIIIKFQHFAKPGNMFDPTVPIPESRLDIISDMILASWGDVMTYQATLSNNPTVNEVLATGRNIIAQMGDSYIRAKDDRYWGVIIHEAWSGRSNPEDIFAERSSKLQNYKNFHADEITDISGASTANEQVLIAALLNVYGHNETIMDIIEDIVPGLVNVNPANMSFEGLWTSLFDKCRYGIISNGMYARPERLYTNGASVQYRDIHQQARHWIARPDLYKPNIIYVDDFATSTLVDLAIEANSGAIGREVTVAHQGNPLNGYFQWTDGGFGTVGGSDGVNCSSVDVRYTITAAGGTVDVGIVTQKGSVDLAEGRYPPDAELSLDVTSEGGVTWYFLYSANVQQMIETNSDVYIRGSGREDGSGFAYVSTAYDDFGPDCDSPPTDTSDVINLVQW